MSCDMHEDWATEVCPECKLQVDEFGNTESQFEFCCFPNCGCDGHRLCAVGKPNENAVKCNVEGMWNNGDKKSIRARQELYGLVNRKE